MNVVLIEEDACLLDLCCEIIGRAGYRVRGCRTPDEALGLLRREATDVLVVDYRVADIAQDDLVARARAICPEVRTVMVTGQAWTEDEAQRAGFIGRVVKPFSPRHLLDAIAAAGAAPMESTAR